MKRGAVESPKVRRLSKRLRTGLATTVGHLELLWHFTSKQAPAGDVGRWADDEIADACDWEGDPAEFVDALVAARWLDPCPTFRLVVHDWHEHADDALRKAMRRRDASLRGVRWEDAEASFARPAAEIPESLRSAWREWQPTAANGGQRQPTADNGGHLPPSPPGPARPGPACKAPPPDGGQEVSAAAVAPPIDAEGAKLLDAAAELIRASAIEVGGLREDHGAAEWLARKRMETAHLQGLVKRYRVTPQEIHDTAAWVTGDSFWRPKVADCDALQRHWKSILGARKSATTGALGARVSSPPPQGAPASPYKRAEDALPWFKESMKAKPGAKNASP